MSLCLDVYMNWKSAPQCTPNRSRNSPEVSRFIATLIAVSSSVPLAFHQCAHLHTKTPNHLQTHTNKHFGNPPSSLLSGVAGSQEVGDDNTAAVFSSSQ